MSKQENKHSGEKNSHFGTCWITKDNKSIVIKKELLNQYLNDGWVKGRKIQNKENIVNANKDKYWINKDGKTKFIYLDKLDEYLNNGWERGRVHNSPKYTYHEPKPHYNPWIGNVLVEIDGKKIYVPKDDPRFKTGEIQAYAKGRIAVIDKDGNKLYVKTDDPRYLSGELQPQNQVRKNKMLAHDKDFNYFLVNKNDERLKTGELLPSTTGIKYSEESRKKMRQNMINHIKTVYGKYQSNYSKRGCEYINKLNEENHWNLQHAENGGEFEVDGYLLDGYDKELNIAFEYDEKGHYADVRNNILKDRDIERQNYIIEKLHCEFWRYNEKLKLLYKVN